MKIVTLVSGGYDSTLLSLIAHEDGNTLFPLFVDYGQLAVSKEWEACKRVHEENGLPEVTRMDLSGFGKVIPSGITNPALQIADDAYLPGRNLLFVLAGAARAVEVQADAVALGLLDPQYALFSDQTQKFVDTCEKMMQVSFGRHITVLTPLIEFSKRDVLALSAERGLRNTYSCHAGGDTACGKCVACLEIANAQQRY